MGIAAEESAFKIFPEAVGEFGAKFIGHPASGALHFFNELVEVAAGAGDGDDTERCGFPGYASSISATEMLKLCRSWSFIDRTT